VSRHLFGLQRRRLVGCCGRPSGGQRLLLGSQGSRGPACQLSLVPLLYSLQLGFVGLNQALKTGGVGKRMVLAAARKASRLLASDDNPWLQPALPTTPSCTCLIAGCLTFPHPPPLPALIPRSPPPPLAPFFARVCSAIQASRLARSEATHASCAEQWLKGGRADDECEAYS